jgi:Bacterial transcriptional activator domain
MSRRPWRAPTGRSPPSPRDAGPRRGGRPGSPATSPQGRSSPDWRRPGSTSGATGWRRCGFAAAGLGLGGPALAQAEERARVLTELAPYRETGHHLLMEALERRGNVAEALRAYERLRVMLREELGVAPSPTVQAVHRRLLLHSADS